MLIKKIADIESAFVKANSNEYALVLNFMSCYIKDALPPAHAPTAAKRINPIFSELLDEGKIAPCVFLCDFVTPELVRSIVEKNFE